MDPSETTPYGVMVENGYVVVLTRLVDDQKVLEFLKKFELEKPNVKNQKIKHMFTYFKIKKK